MSEQPSRDCPEVSIVIPAKNEADNIVPLVNEIRAAMDGRFDYELIYVDDGSTDDTWNELQTLSESNPHLLLVRHQQSVGQSLAIISGAWQARGEWLVVLDADGQNDPADIPGMLEAVQGANQRDPAVWGVIGHRVNRRDDWVKRLSSKVANGFRDLLLNDGIPDMLFFLQCGYRKVKAGQIFGK